MTVAVLDDLERAEHQRQQVWEWRKQIAVQAGLDEHDAEVLASGEVDSHEILRLAEKGCPPSLIFELLV